VSSSFAGQNHWFLESFLLLLDMPCAHERSTSNAQHSAGHSVESWKLNLKDAPMAPWIHQKCQYLQDEIAFRAPANNLTFC
jgi:hypothetical protein